MMSTVTAVAMDVPAPESQRLIAVSLGKIAASRGQKGGINLHKNLLVATVLHKARTAYMIQQHMNAAKQRVAAGAAATPTTTTTQQQQPQAVDMKDQSHHRHSEQPAAASTSTSTTSTSAASVVAAAAPTFHTPSSSASSSTTQAAAPLNNGSVSAQQTAARPETGSANGADVWSPMQVAEGADDKENTPPPQSKDATLSSSSTLSLDCEKRLTMDSTKASAKEPLTSSSAAMSHAQQQQSTRDNVTSAPTSCSSCVLKRRRATDRDNENVSAPKVRILDCRLSSSKSSNTDTSSVVIGSSSSSNPEPMQCDSPQISSLVNIFNSSFSGLSGTVASAAADMSVRSAVGQSLLSSVASSHSHKLSENLTCAKEMKFGLDSVHQPIALSV